MMLEDTFQVFLGRRSWLGTASLLQDRVLVKQQKVCLTRDGPELDIQLGDLIGCQCANIKTSNPDKASPLFPPFPAPSQTGPVFLCLYWYPKQTNRAGKDRVRRQPVLFQVTVGTTFRERAEVAERWRRTIYQLRAGVECPRVGQERPILFLVNPHSGRGRALSVFNNQVLPVLKESGALYVMVLTTRRNHGRDLVQQEPDLVARWRAVVVVSGDGLVHEVYNGMFSRADWDRVVRNLPVGVVAGGSGNGLAKSISFENKEADDLQASLRAVRCLSSPMDIVSVQMAGGNIYSFLSISWGFLSDIDIESESLRKLGEARFYVWTLLRAVNLRLYRGRLSYLPAKGTETSGALQAQRRAGSCLRRMGPSGEMKGGSQKTESCLRSEEPSSGTDLGSVGDGTKGSSDMERDWEINSWRTGGVPYNHGSSLDLDSPSRVRLYSTGVETNVDSMTSDTSSRNQQGDSTISRDPNGEEMFDSVSDWGADINCQVNTLDLEVNTPDLDHLKVNTPDLDLPPLSDPVPSTWTTVEDDFALVLACHQSHISSTLLSSPWSLLSDGLMYLFTIRRGAFPDKRVSRATLAQFLMGMLTGVHMFTPGVEMIPVTAFRLCPLEERGHVTVDGEEMPRGDIQAIVLPGRVRVVK